MRKTLLAIVFVAALTGVGAVSVNAQVSMQNVMKRASAVVEKLESQKAQILFMQIDTLEKGDISTQSYNLEAGQEYAIVAIGDEERIQDIDLVVVDDNAKVIGKDDDEENIALVKVKPKKSGTFNLGVKGFKMARNDGFYAVIICRID
jgi:hypothetical protein